MSKKLKLEVLEEDDFAAGLSVVIQKDFFPELQELRDTQEWLEADRRDDYETKLKVEARKRTRQTPGRTPGGQTPMMGEQRQPQAQKERGMESVDAFLSLYTSEDNMSFAELQAIELEQRKEEDKWGQQAAALRAIEGSKRMLLLEAGDTKNNTVLAIEGNTDLNRQMMGIPDSTVYERQLILAAEESKDKVIDPENTRFTADAIKRLNTLPKPVDPDGKRKKLSEIVQKNRFLAEMSGRKLNGVQSIDLDDFYDQEEGEALASDPKVRGFEFVSTPSIVPGSSGVETPIVSWGTVQGTPILLLNGADSGRQFQIPQVPERDKLAKTLAEGSMTKRTTPNIHHGTSGGTSRRTPLVSPVFSPAGQKLLEERLKSKSSSSSSSSSSSAFFKSPAVPLGGASISRSKFVSPSVTSSRKKSSNPTLLLTPK